MPGKEDKFSSSKICGYISKTLPRLLENIVSHTSINLLIKTA